VFWGYFGTVSRKITSSRTLNDGHFYIQYFPYTPVLADRWQTGRCEIITSFVEIVMQRAQFVSVSVKCVLRCWVQVLSASLQVCTASVINKRRKLAAERVNYEAVGQVTTRSLRVDGVGNKHSRNEWKVEISGRKRTSGLRWEKFWRWIDKNTFHICGLRTLRGWLRIIIHCIFCKP